MTLANYLYTLVYSDMYDVDKWRDWAEQLLLNAEYNDDTEWVYNVYLSLNQEKLFEGICERRYSEKYYGCYKYGLSEIIHGYYFFQYQNKQINLYELLLQSGEVADSFSDCTEDCEFFYNLYNKLKEQPELAVSEDFTKIIYEYFNPRFEEAMKQKEELESATLEDLEILY